ncbi:hypothetical protein K3175_01645 [Qipengyuania sp. GH1]|uniref:hypothetical protein n=1 Tax=Qipengyuania aestuarii TaxID=2867241 RepID=UPI001C88B965|nr:hypothetical protein [Qipengyuania aestuarii]MBX7534355.1 hypothetical protein [Qipengyuania aestuarii]
MRIAVLSTTDTDSSRGEPRAAFRTLAGATIADRQLDLALRLGCERIVCLADSIGPEIVGLQSRAETAGTKFRAVKSSSRLPGMIGPDDEMLLISNGLLVDDDAAVAALEEPSVLAFPADLAVPLGFERIDLGLAWSGILLGPGKLTSDLQHLPGDVDAVSSLLRIALQHGVPPVLLDRKLLAKGDWQLAPDADALAVREKRWIDAQRERISFRAPGMAVAERAGARLARDIVGRKTEIAPTLLAVACAIAAMFAAWFELPGYGLVLTTAVALFRHLAVVVQRISAAGTGKDHSTHLQAILDYGLDPLFIILLGLSAYGTLGWMSFFIPLVLFGLLRLGERYANERWRRTYADRVGLGVVLSVAAFFHLAAEVAAVLALIVLASRFFNGARAS